MDFKVKFNLDNDAYSWNTENEVADTLQYIAEQIKNGIVQNNITDYNGNVVGSWEFTN